MDSHLPAQLLDTAIPASPTINSVNSIVRRAGGLMVWKDLVLAANNATASMNAFQLTGSVIVKKLWGVVTAKTTLANLTAGSWDLYDSTAVVQLTANDGVLSGVPVGTVIAKNDHNTVTFAKGSSAAGVIIEPNTERFWNEFVMVQKAAANTFVRFTYTTSDAPIAATLTVFCSYVPLSSDGALVAV
jgi:hypothetical protein